METVSKLSRNHPQFTEEAIPSFLGLKRHYLTKEGRIDDITRTILLIVDIAHLAAIFSASCVGIPKYVLERKEYVESKFRCIKNEDVKTDLKVKTYLPVLQAAINEIKRKTDSGLFSSPALLKSQIQSLQALSTSGKNFGVVKFFKLILQYLNILIQKGSRVDYLLRASARRKTLSILMLELKQFLGLSRETNQKLHILGDTDDTLEMIPQKLSIIYNIIQTIPIVLRRK
jgi:hypothetical protein